jgi:hypothetical protein
MCVMGAFSILIPTKDVLLVSAHQRPCTLNCGSHDECVGKSTQYCQCNPGYEGEYCGSIPLAFAVGIERCLRIRMPFGHQFQKW